MISPATAFPDRIKWSESFDPTFLQNEVRSIVSELTQQSYVYYHVVPLDDGPVKDSPAFKWAETPMLKGCSYFEEMLRFFRTEVTSVRLMRLEAGAEVREHSDPLLDAAHREVVRLTVPIFSNDDVTFLLNGTPVPMHPGELWYMRLSDRHSVLNNSPEERINLSIDVTYNDWLEEKLVTYAKLDR